MLPKSSKGQIRCASLLSWDLYAKWISDTVRFRWIPALFASLVRTGAHRSRATQCGTPHSPGEIYPDLEPRHLRHRRPALTQQAFPTYEWADSLLQVCGIAFKPPIVDATWQYQLQGPDSAGIHRELHADIGMKFVDADGPNSAFAEVVEAKARGGKLKIGKDTDESYTRLPQLASFSRKFVVLLLDQSDINSAPKGRPVITWQAIAKIQLDELARLNLPVPTKSHLTALMQSHLGWYRILDRRPSRNAAVLQPIDASSIKNIEPRVASLIRGAEIVVGRSRLPVNVPTGFEKECSLEEFSALAMEGRAVHKGTAEWQALCW